MSSIPPFLNLDYQADENPPDGNDLASALGALAAVAAFEEALLSPKPGLVCPGACGSHTDMDWITFLMGAAALVPFWRVQARHGLNSGHCHYYKPLKETAEKLRRTGLEMEAAMFGATDGINTHKGLIFALSLLLGAAGICAGPGEFSPDKILETAGKLIAPRVAEEFDDIKRKEKKGCKLTHGERVYLSYGIGGIRAEAARGFPSLTAALNAFNAALALGAAYRDAALKALLALMSRCEDTNIIHRGGMDFWRGEYMKLVAETDGRFDPANPGRYEPVWELDRLLVERGVSPGGAADMLACTLFIYRSKVTGNISSLKVHVKEEVK